MKISKDERRLHPRIEKELPVRITTNGFDFATSTQNISCVGAYCRIDKYIPPFTKIFIKLNLPIRNQKSKNEGEVECKGVIVRTEDDPSNGFNIAIFFNDIKDNQRKKISHYLSQFLPQDSS